MTRSSGSSGAPASGASLNGLVAISVVARPSEAGLRHGPAEARTGVLERDRVGDLVRRKIRAGLAVADEARRRDRAGRRVDAQGLRRVAARGVVGDRVRRLDGGAPGGVPGPDVGVVPVAVALAARQPDDGVLVAVVVEVGVLHGVAAGPGVDLPPEVLRGRRAGVERLPRAGVVPVGAGEVEALDGLGPVGARGAGGGARGAEARRVAVLGRGVLGAAGGRQDGGGEERGDDAAGHGANTVHGANPRRGGRPRAAATGPGPSVDPEALPDDGASTTRAGPLRTPSGVP